MNTNSSNIDIAIIGAGITGLGVALALQDSGLRVAVFEKGSCAKATSNNHLRIIHGGFRYLQHLNLKRMWQSSGDQIRLAKRYPHLLQELACVLPLKLFGLRSKWPLTMAGLFYSMCYAYQARKLAARFGIMSASYVEESLPLLKQQATHGAFKWYDYILIDNHSLVEEITNELSLKSINIFENSGLSMAENVHGLWKLNFTGDTVQQVSAKFVINCTGPWVESVANLLGQNLDTKQLGWSKAFNLVVKGNFSNGHGIAFDSENEGTLFMTPRLSDTTAIGTFYLPTKQVELESQQVSSDEVAKALDCINASLPDLKLSRDQVIAVEQGILPAHKNHAKNSKPQLLNHELVIEDDQALHVVSIKYTTFLSLGERVAALVGKSINV